MGRFAVGGQRPEEARYRFDDLTELVFAFPQSLLGALVLFNIQIHSDPLQYGSIARPERFGATEEPAVASLSVTNSKTPLTALARAQTGRPIFLCFSAVVRMHEGKMGVPLCANVDAETQRVIFRKTKVVRSSFVHKGEPAGRRRVPGKRGNHT
jgi:hypothetical protein